MNLYPELEKLRPLALPLAPARPGDWLWEHPEPGQTFEEYLLADPVRRSDRLHTLYVCLLGHFTESERQVLDQTQHFLGLFFDVPVILHKEVPLASIPERAKRLHPEWEDAQVLSTYVLRRVLKPDRPGDALAYLAFTASDLWPGEGWNFVFGEANLRARLGVWSIYRNGDPSEDEAAFRLCLRRTLLTAAHEMGHILTMKHCTAYRCLMNGSNHQQERDRKPLHLCPICLRKLCWNLQVKPVPYLRRLAAFCRAQALEGAGWLESAAQSLAGA